MVKVLIRIMKIRDNKNETSCRGGYFYPLTKSIVNDTIIHMSKLYNISQTAKLLGVAVRTLQAWDKEGKLVAQRTVTNRRVYSDAQLRAFREGKKEQPASEVTRTVSSRKGASAESTYTVSQAARVLGVSVATLQRWDRQDKLKSHRTATNRRVYTESQIQSACKHVRNKREPVEETTSASARINKEESRSTTRRMEVSNGLALLKSVEYNGNVLDCYVQEGQEELGDFWATREQIGQLLGYERPNEAIGHIHDRNKERLDRFSTVLKLSKVEGSRTVTREMTVYNFKGLLEVCRYSNQPKADAVIDKLWEIADEIRRTGMYSSKKSHPQMDGLSSIFDTLPPASGDLPDLAVFLKDVMNQTRQQK